MFAGRLGIVLVVAALCLGGRAAHAQAGPMGYWSPGWLGFGGNLDAGEDANTHGRFAEFDGGGAGGFSSTRYNFSNGWFVGNERGGMGSGLGLGGVDRAGAFGSLQTEGVQFGYTFKNTAVSVYGGFDTLKYDPGIGAAFRRSTPRPARPAMACMPASNSGRRRISACRSGSATPSRRVGSTPTQGRPRCPTLPSPTSSAARADAAASSTQR